MPARAESIPPWERSRYVLAYEGEVIGAIDVVGLEGVLDSIDDVAHHRRTSFPNLRIAPIEDGTNTWFRAWPFMNGPKRDIVIRDNRKDHWFHISGAWIQRPSYGPGSDNYTVVIDSAVLGDGPFM